MLLLIKLKADKNYNSPITLLYRLSYICMFGVGYKFDQQCQESNQTLGGIEPLPFIATGPAGSPWRRWLDSNQRPTAPKAKYLSYTMPLFIKLQADKNQDSVFLGAVSTISTTIATGTKAGLEPARTKVAPWQRSNCHVQCCLMHQFLGTP